MTALCGGGPSGPKPGQPAVSYLTGNALENILQVVFGVSEVWASIIVFAAAQSIDWSVLCATDPPAMPTLTGTEVLDILATPWDVTQPAFQRAQDLILIGLWYYGCQCTTTSQPTPPTWPTYPTGAPQVNPPGTPVGTQGPCLNTSGSITVGATRAQPPTLANSAFAPGLATTTVTPHTSGIGTQAVVIPATSTQYGNDAEINNTQGFSSQELLGDCFDSAGVYINQVAFVAGGSHHVFQSLVNWPTGTRSVQFFVQAFGDPPNTTTFTLKLKYFCPSSSQPNTPCCPPDPTLVGLVTQVLNFVSSIYAGLPVALSSMSEATVHSGLTGSGHFLTAAGAIGCKVVFTPSNAQGELAGDPLTVFNAGWLTTSAVEGNYKTRRLEHSPELILFDPLVDTVHYTLSGGVTATITEITRGP